MKASSPVASTEDLGQHGPWRFTREHVVEPALALAFYELYEAAFAPLRVRAMARQVLTEAEFGAQMRNGAVSKIVAWDATGTAVGLCALTPQLSAVPWISPEYFAARYPEHWARGAVWYLAFVLAHPSQRHSRFLDHMVEVGVGPLVQAGAVSKIVAWDASGRAVGLCALTPQLSAVPWISPHYFAARYPEHWERGAVWYLAFVLAHPSQRHSRFLDHMVEVGVGPLVQAGAVCAYDICAYNDEVLGLGPRLARCFERTTGATPRPVDTQNYYEVRFS